MKNSKNILNLLLPAVCVFLISGCSVIGVGSTIAMLGKSGNTTDENLLDKAEMALGISKNNLEIDRASVTDENREVRFKVIDSQNNEYRCYFTYVGDNESDAICNEISSLNNSGDKKKSGTKNTNKKKSKSPKANCNELLKAAGKC